MQQISPETAFILPSASKCKLKSREYTTEYKQTYEYRIQRTRQDANYQNHGHAR